MALHREWNLACKVYIGNLGNNGSRSELEEIFSRYGQIKNVFVARNPPGFAFIEFENERNAEEAARALDGSRMCGSRVTVEMSSGKSRRDERRELGRDGPPAYRERDFNREREFQRQPRDFPPRERDFPPRERDYPPRERDFQRERDFPRHREAPREREFVRERDVAPRDRDYPPRPPPRDFPRERDYHRDGDLARDRDPAPRGRDHPRERDAGGERGRRDAPAYDNDGDRNRDHSRSFNRNRASRSPPQHRQRK